MIFTSSYQNWQTNRYTTYAISGNRRKDVQYDGQYYPKLAPKLSFWLVWHNQIGKIKDEENNRYYIEEYWKKVLSQLNPQEVYQELDGSVLLCYEDYNQFCHRHIVAAWLEIFLGIQVPEVKLENEKIVEVPRPSYIKDSLEEIIKKETNMRGFTSLRALYLFLKGEKLEEKADRLEKETGKCYDHLRQHACFYRCDADEAEYEYRKSHKKRILAKEHK